MLLPPLLAEFVARVVDLQRGIVAALEPSEGSEVGARIEAEGAEVDWRRWLVASVRPQLDHARALLDEARARREREQPIHAFELALQAEVAALPDTVLLYPSSVEASRRDDAAQLETPLRHWLELELLPAITPASAALERAQLEALQDMATRIEEIERVLAYYVLAVQRHAAEFEPSQAEELARTGLDRIQRLIAELHRQHGGRLRRALAELLARTSDALDDALAPFRAHRPELVVRALAERERGERADEPGWLGRARVRFEWLGRGVWPLAQQLGLELRTLFDGREPAPARAATRSLLTSDPSGLGVELPLSYRRLFAIVPIQIADLFVRRPQLEQVCATTIERWLSGAPQTLLVHGDRGSGKRTLVNHVLAFFRGRVPLDVRWIRLGPRLREEPAVARVLGQALGLASPASEFAELRGARVGERRVIVLENSERLLEPSLVGIARMREFLATIRATAESTLWILLMATPAAALALHRLGLGNRVSTVLQIEPMTSAELRAMIESRHRLSGFELEFPDVHARLLERIVHPLTSLRERAPIEGFFVRLARLSGGNPRQALYYWLASAHPCPQRPERVLLEPLPNTALELLASLTLPQRLLLATLAQHGSLALDELALALAEPRESVAGDIDVLATIGYLAPSRELGSHWMVRSPIAHLLLLELRARNMA